MTCEPLDSPYGIIIPIRVAANKTLSTICLGSLLSGIALTPDSKLAYVASIGGILTPIQTATGRHVTAINLHQVIEDIAIAP